MRGRKLSVHVSLLTPAEDSTDPERIEIKFSNTDSVLKSPIVLQHLYWIDLKNNEDFMSFSDGLFLLPRTINPNKTVVHHVPTQRFKPGPDSYEFVAHFSDAEQKHYISLYNFHVSRSKPLCKYLLKDNFLISFQTNVIVWPDYLCTKLYLLSLGTDYSSAADVCIATKFLSDLFVRQIMLNLLFQYSEGRPD